MLHISFRKANKNTNNKILLKCRWSAIGSMWAQSFTAKSPLAGKELQDLGNMGLYWERYSEVANKLGLGLLTHQRNVCSRCKIGPDYRVLWGPHNKLLEVDRVCGNSQKSKIKAHENYKYFLFQCSIDFSTNKAEHNYAFHKGEMLRGIYHYYHKSNKNKFGFEKQAVVVNVQGFLLSLHISYLPCSQPEPLLVLVFFQFVSLIIAFFIILYFFLK